MNVSQTLEPRGRRVQRGVARRRPHRRRSGSQQMPSPLPSNQVATAGLALDGHTLSARLHQDQLGWQPPKRVPRVKVFLLPITFAGASRRSTDIKLSLISAHQLVDRGPARLWKSRPAFGGAIRRSEQEKETHVAAAPATWAAQAPPLRPPLPDRVRKHGGRRREGHESEVNPFIHAAQDTWTAKSTPTRRPPS